MGSNPIKRNNPVKLTTSRDKDEKMKILHLMEGPAVSNGGTISLHRLHRDLQEAGIHSKILCTSNKWPSGDADDIIRVQSSGIEKRVASLLKNISQTIGLQGMLDPTHFRVVRDKAFLDADLLTIHRIRGLCSPLAIPVLTRSKPTVLVLRDMMSFTGHCFHSLDCERWKTGCGKCPYPNIAPPISMDNTRLAAASQQPERGH